MNRTDRARFVLEQLREVIPRPESELGFVDEYQLIVAVILSAQCTDARVNKVTPALFEAFPRLDALAQATPEQVYPLIKSVSYPNNKAKHLVGMAQRVQADFGGRIPQTPQDLVKLPGVGRKTAQVVASVAFDDEDSLPVDTHIFRVANRIGLVNDANTPLKVERGLKRVVPRAAWGEAHHLLILHGRYTCTARKPACETCSAAPGCLYFERLRKLPAPLVGLDPKQGKFFCKTEGRYFEEPVVKTDRHGTEQVACPHCNSMQVFLSKTGEPTKKVPDYRV